MNLKMSTKITTLGYFFKCPNAMFLVTKKNEQG